MAPSRKPMGGLYPTYGVSPLRYRRIRIEGASYFFTVVTHNRQPILKGDAAVTLFMSALRSIQCSHSFELEAYVILPDHLHMIWTLPGGDSDYPTRWRQIKSAFTRSIATKDLAEVSPSRKSKLEQAIWQRRYWEHTIASDGDFAAHVEYIHFNPVKHKLAARPRDWPHSSFHDWVKRGQYDCNWGADDYRLVGPNVQE
ncbi:MAG: transposase [Hyphomicrobium sp.]